MVAGRFIPELHGLRGLSAFWVMLYHTTPGGFGPFKAPAYGYLGVDVFFLLSGYVLMHTHGSGFARLDGAGVLRFLRLRWWRVYPLYAAAMVFGVLAARARWGVWPSSDAVLGSAVLLEGWLVPGIAMNGPAWSLGVECIGYLAFPLLAWAILRLGWGARLAMAVAANVVLAWVIGTFAEDWNPYNYGLAVARMGAEFGAGCVLWSLARDCAGWQRHYGDAVAGLGVAGLCVALWAGAPALSAGLLAVVIFGAAGSGRWSAAVLTNGPAMFLGRISFAIYITHWIILVMIKQVFGQPESAMERAAVTLLFYAVALPFATLACVCIEEPARRWSRRFFMPSVVPSMARPGRA